MNQTSTLTDALESSITRLAHVLLREAGHGLSRTAASVLHRLATAGPQRITELADWESVAQPTMTTLVGRLEAQGLVRRDPDPADRRAVLVAVTTRGEETVDLRRRARAVALDVRLERLDDDERARLRYAVPALVRLAEPEARR
jgi:DNA-binding MarR family transcriptional regulator